MMELKYKVLKVREILFISQKTLAKELGISFATVNRWENGHSKPNTIAKARFDRFCKDNNIIFEEINNV